MSKFSSEFKEQMITKMLQDPNLNVQHFSQKHGISESVLYRWMKLNNIETTMIKRNSNSVKWSAERKLKAVAESLSFNQHELSIYCRENGLYPEDLNQWKAQTLSCYDAPAKSLTSATSRQDKKRINELSKELNRKEKALAEAAALLVLRKKSQALWGEDVEQ